MKKYIFIIACILTYVTCVSQVKIADISGKIVLAESIYKYDEYVLTYVKNKSLHDICIQSIKYVKYANGSILYFNKKSSSDTNYTQPHVFISTNTLTKDSIRLAAKLLVKSHIPKWGIYFIPTELLGEFRILSVGAELNITPHFSIAHSIGLCQKTSKISNMYVFYKNYNYFKEGDFENKLEIRFFTPAIKKKHSKSFLRMYGGITGAYRNSDFSDYSNDFYYQVDVNKTTVMQVTGLQCIINGMFIIDVYTGRGFSSYKGEAKITYPTTYYNYEYNREETQNYTYKMNISKTNVALTAGIKIGVLVGKCK